MYRWCFFWVTAIVEAGASKGSNSSPTPPDPQWQHNLRRFIKILPWILASTPIDRGSTKDDNLGKTIVELGAGDYGIARNVARKNPLSTVIATNDYNEWWLGKRFVDRNHYTKETEFVTGIYNGWQIAKAEGLIVGEESVLTNEQVGTGIADVIYVNYPYNHTAYDFGEEAARIASIEPGTRVFITSSEGGWALRDFQRAFLSERSKYTSQIGIGFVPIPQSPFGVTAIDWEPLGTQQTLVYLQP